MTKLQSLRAFALSAISILAGGGLVAQQVGDPATLIKEKLVSQIKLTKATDAHDDIVTAGDVVQLHKDGLMMCSSAGSYAFSNSYQNGVLIGTLNNRAKDAAKNFVRGKLPFGGGNGGVSDAANNGCASRKFVSGEKFWITDIRIAKDNSGIIVSTFSDAYNNIRYYGEIKFPFPSKASVPPVDDEVKTVAEVLTVVPSDDAGKGQSSGASQSSSGDKQSGNSQGASGAAEPAPAVAAAPAPPLAPIAPPPPPSDPVPQQTKSIAVGQTKNDVLATWGQPAKDIKLSSKEIFVYPDMKVTFVGGKVSDVQ
jgi:hypothetical protein